MGDDNPFRYRGYYYDTDTGLYYLKSRYYDPELRRFISSDTPAVATASPGNANWDKNLFAYCDNNPVTRKDDGGQFWLTTIALGMASQYVGDVIGNVIRGKTGADIFKPTSTVGEYLAAGVTALIPGAGFGRAVIRNLVSEGIKVTEAAISGAEINLLQSGLNITVGSVLDYGFEQVTDKVLNRIDSAAPRNYSNYAHHVRQKNPNMAREDIIPIMKRTTRLFRTAHQVTQFLSDSIRCSLAY